MQLQVMHLKKCLKITALRFKIKNIMNTSQHCTQVEKRRQVFLRCKESKHSFSLSES